MLLKLYKRDKDKISYWEAWDEEAELTIHFGDVGDVGETTTVSLAEFEPPDSAIEEHAKDARDAGFSEIDHEDLFELVVQYPLAAAAGPDDIEKAYRVEELLNECLGWTGNGHCEGNDIGPGSLNVYCFVVDPKLALKPVVDELSQADLVADAVIAYHDKDESFVVLWPEGYSGVFNY
jgi:hypothetical protein